MKTHGCHSIPFVACIVFASIWSGVSTSASAQPAAPERPTSVTAPSLLTNGGFEEGNLEPAGWKKGNDVPGVEYLWTSGVSYEGKASLCLRKTEKRYWPVAEWYQEISHDGSARPLTVEAMVKAQDLTKAVLDVQFHSPSGESTHKWAIYLGAKNPNDPPVMHDWKPYRGEVDIPDGTTSLRIAFQIYGPGVVAVDNLAAKIEGGAGPATAGAAAGESSESSPGSESTLRAEAAPVSRPFLLVNAGCEEGQDAPTGWTQGNDIPGVEYIWDRNQGHGGTSSLCIRKTANRYFPIAFWSQAVEKDRPARLVRVRAWVKAESMTKAILDVVFVDSQGEWISHKWAAYIGSKNANEPPATHDWKPYGGEVPIPPGTARVEIALQVYGPGTVWFDDIEAQWVE